MKIYYIKEKTENRYTADILFSKKCINYCSNISRCEK